MTKIQRLNELPQAYLQDGFPVYMFWSRAIEIPLALIVLALSSYVLSIKAVVSLPTYTGLNLFTAIFTLIVIAYVVTAPKYARNFYHVYVECLLEFALTVLWLSSFASLANWVGTLDQWGISDATWRYQNCRLDEESLQVVCDHSNGKRAASAAKAIVAFGAFLFALCCANFVFLIVYIIRLRQARRAGNPDAMPGAGTSTSGPPAPSTTAGDPELGYQETKSPATIGTPQPIYSPQNSYGPGVTTSPQPQVQPQMPPRFAGSELSYGAPPPPHGVAEVPGQKM